MKTRLNRIYHNMKQRCYNPKFKYYKHYGGRGVTVCNEWLDDKSEGYPKITLGWLAFKKWALSNGYSDNLTLDRIDVNKGYSPENCRWVTQKEQLNNTRRNVYITYQERTQTLSQWCNELGIEYDTVFSRLYRYHWTVERAFSTKENPNLVKITYKGVTKTLYEWAKEIKINPRTLYGRIFTLHWSIGRAMKQKYVKRERLVLYKNKSQTLGEWCKELKLNYGETYRRLYRDKWSPERVFETRSRNYDVNN